MNNLQLKNVIGRGSHGTVYQGLWHNKDVAIKQVRRSKDTASIHHEVTFVQKIHHPNIVEFYDVIVEPEHVYIVMDLIEGKNALQIMDAGGAIQEKTLKTWTKHIVDALDTLHRNGYVYNDLKPSNIMLRKHKNETNLYEPILVDFGSTIRVPKKQLLQKPLGTPLYFAPEKLTWNYGVPSDIWSLGITLYKLSSGIYPFIPKHIDSLMDLEYAILYEPLSYNSAIWFGKSTNLKDLIALMLCRDPLKRITAPEIIKHPWFEEIDQ